MNQELELILTEIRQGFKEVNQKFDAVDQRFDAMDHKFDAIDQKLVQVDQKFGRIDDRLNRIERKVDGIQKQVVKNSEGITTLTVKVDEQAKILTTLSLRSIAQEGEIRNLKQVR